MKLAGKIAVITGGSSGIGLETARLFLEEGAEVAILGRDEARLRSAVTTLGNRPFSVQADVARPDEIAAAMQQIGEKFGGIGIDILFANAGTSHCPELEATTEADFDALMSINVKGVFFTFLYALPLLREGASVVLAGSVAARKGRPGDPLYAASKGAVRSLGRTLAVSEEALARKIRVNVVTPGATITPLTSAATENDDVRQYVESLVPMGRWGESQEVARTVLFLASSDASYITGAEITVDGGLSHV